ncbi:DUF393 domain-containing protein [Halomonas sp. DP8Y7-3]|nr:DUF393 domain-containing protein [Halomonas sp. DP8Y7-3]
MILKRFDDIIPPVTLFHDGGCPLCRREVAWLRGHPRRDRIRFVDIRHPDFDAAQWGKRIEDMMGKLHLLDARGHWIVGMDASRALYATLGYRRWLSFSMLPGMRQALDLGYRLFAKLRPWLGRHRSG